MRLLSLYLWRKVNELINTTIILSLPFGCLMASDAGTGLTGDYFASENHGGAPVRRVDPIIDFSWGGTSPAPGIAGQWFSVRWTGQIQTRVDGDCTLITTSDDGIRVWVDGQLLINNWTWHGNTEDRCKFASQAGRKHDLRIEYFQSPGGSRMRLEWQGAGEPRAVVPSVCLYPQGADTPALVPSTQGLAAVFFANMNHEGAPVLSRIDPQVDFDWSRGSPGIDVPCDRFSAVWSGKVLAPVSGQYTFHVTSDNGRSLWVDQYCIIDKWVDDWGIDYSGTVTLTAGQSYDIRLDYFENNGQANVKLEWEAPGLPRAVIPADALIPVPLPPRHVGSGTGLAAAYFPGEQFTGIPIQKIDRTINFTWPTIPCDGIPADYFSVRWQGSIQPVQNGDTTLVFSADDGMRVWFDGQLVVDDWTIHGTRVYRHAFNADVARKYDLRIDFFDHNYTAVARMEWEGPLLSRQAIPSTQLYPASQLIIPAPTIGSGLSSAYFSNKDLIGQPWPRRDRKIDFKWGGSAPGGGLPADLFSVRWTGKIQTRFNELYTLITTSDDGVRLWIDGQLVIDNWTLHGPTENRYTFTAEAGRKYDLRMEMFENYGGAVARLEWQSACEGRSVVPEGCLYPNDLDIVIPTASSVSPAFIEGVHGPCVAPVVNIGDKHDLGETRFYVDVPLSETGPASFRVSGGNMSVDGLIAWSPTSLAGDKTIIIRPGDSLLFAAIENGHWSASLNCGTWKDPVAISAGDRVALTFPDPGTYQVIGEGTGGEIVGVTTIRVPSVDFHEVIACEVLYRRIKDVSLSQATDRSFLTFTPADDWIDIGNDGKAITVKPNLLRSSALVARIAGGTILSSCEIRPFYIRTNAEKRISTIYLYDDKSMLLEGGLVLSPPISGLSIAISIFVAGVTFDDSTTVMNVNTSDYPASADSVVIPYRLIKAPGTETGACHTWRVCQNGTQVSN